MNGFLLSIPALENMSHRKIHWQTQTVRIWMRMDLSHQFCKSGDLMAKWTWRSHLNDMELKVLTSRPLNRRIWKQKKTTTDQDKESRESENQEPDKFHFGFQDLWIKSTNWDVWNEVLSLLFSEPNPEICSWPIWSIFQWRGYQFSYANHFKSLVAFFHVHN
jgi:hypothetical protein